MTHLQKKKTILDKLIFVCLKQDTSHGLCLPQADFIFKKKKLKKLNKIRKPIKICLAPIVHMIVKACVQILFPILCGKLNNLYIYICQFHVFKKKYLI